ncbi:hypothetical protein SDC9_167250 [bioreactor metagenome]|uniref:Uncharacterized protein n=1 Tax=bioreactor metagenome TaxID=1076179 RepID=A0A645FZQ7_9ZZZZ
MIRADGEIITHQHDAQVGLGEYGGVACHAVYSV